MNYTSINFWVLFLGVICVYWRLSHRQQNRLLLVVSYVFYGLWDYRFLFLILTSTLIDYIGGLGLFGTRLPRRKLLGLGALFVGSAFLLCGHIDYGLLRSLVLKGNLLTGLAMSLPHTLGDFKVPIAAGLSCLGYAIALPRLYGLGPKARRIAFLTISMVGNLGILCFFKYHDFFMGSLKDLFVSLGLGDPGFVVLRLILPAGISFYTFQAMSYTIDIYRGRVEPTNNFSDFALFVCFFPHLIAGPIMRAHTLLPQVTGKRSPAPGAFVEGLQLVLLGLFKKLVIADNMAPLVNAVFLPFQDGTATTANGLEIMMGVYAFAFQIYGDFAGYSAVARGISKWLGFELVVNFDHPYLSTSPRELWRRWHISLSSWLRDYLYIPLGGNRGSSARTLGNQMLTMGLGGLWHGANWTFILWGLYHGAILAVARFFKVRDLNFSGPLKERLAFILRVFVMFNLTCLGWLFFRADSLATIGRMLRAATSLHASVLAVAAGATILFYCGPLFLIEVWTGGEKRLGRISGSHWAFQSALYCYLLFMLVIFRADQIHEFIYFQF